MLCGILLRELLSSQTSIVRAVSRPTRFEHFQYLGDKRTQIVYDLDLADGNDEVAAAIDELLKSEQFAAFGPDTLAEARNRGYRPHRSIGSERRLRRSRSQSASSTPFLRAANATSESAGVDGSSDGSLGSPATSTHDVQPP